MKTLIRVILPAILGITVSAFVSHKIFERYGKEAPSGATAAPSAPQVHGSLVNLHTNGDEFPKLKRGKVLLVFLTTDCGACEKEVVNLLSLTSSNLAPKIGVHGVFVEPRENVIAFAEEQHITFPILMDHGGKFVSRLGFKYMPTKVLLHDGTVKKVWHGSSPDLATLVRDLGEEMK